MSQTPAIIPSAMNNLCVPTPPEMLAKLAANFAGAYEDFSAQFRAISLKGNRFTLKEGSSADTLPVNELPVILLGLGHDNHCVYYKDKYKPRMDNIQPTAVWYQKNPAPASVPASALQKGVDGFLGYQVRRRMVVALMQQNQTDGSFYADLAKPYVLDIGAKSIYGEDYPMNMAFTLSGLIRFCSRQRIMPIHFITKLVFDTNSSVPALRFVP